MRKQVKWEPVAVKRIGEGHVYYLGNPQVEIKDAVKIAERIFEQLGDAGVYYGARMFDLPVP